MSARRGVLSWHRLDELCGHPIRQNSLLFIFLVLSQCTHNSWCVSLAQDFKIVVFATRLFHLHVSPMMSSAHSSSTSCLHMSVPPSSLSSSSATASSTITSQVTLPINKHCVDPQNEEFGSVAKTTSSAGYEPNVIDNFDYSETKTAIFQNESVDLRQTYHSHEESLLPAQSFFTRTSTGRPVYEPREELQKSHVLKLEELSRRKLTEYFEEVTSFLQGSNVKTVYILGDNDAKYPDAEIDDEHTRNSLVSPLYLQEREASASLLQFYHSQKRKLVSTIGCHNSANLTKS